MKGTAPWTAKKAMIAAHAQFSSDKVFTGILQMTVPRAELFFAPH
jgi:hypothetical protein